MKDHLTVNKKKQHSFSIPFSFGTLENRTGIILAGDIGGTKTNLSIFELNNGVLDSILESAFPTKEFASFQELFSHFATEKLPKIDSICLGVAGPVLNGKVSGTNFSWGIDAEEIKKDLGVKEVTVINDLEANAYGLAALEEKDLRKIKNGMGNAGNAAIISPGTGLGEAGLFWDGRVFHPFATEGGHCDFSPRNDLDVALWYFLRDRFGIVSWERILSGSGIFNIYQFLVQHNKVEEPAWFLERLKEEDPAALISSCAREGTYSICKDSMDLFLKFLATEAAQVALKFKATGGIYIGGGILPKVIDLLNEEEFMQHFLNADRMKALLENISISIILNEHTPKYGTALFAGMQLQETVRES